VVEFSVRDTGRGIAGDVRQRLFEPFFTTKQPGHGHGLGLSTVRQIISQRGGSLKSRANQEKAPRLWFAFPQSDRSNFINLNRRRGNSS
jgi:C4-dicarboxylate-specific signal transduction histidine kinase